MEVRGAPRRSRPPRRSPCPRLPVGTGGPPWDSPSTRPPEIVSDRTPGGHRVETPVLPQTHGRVAESTRPWPIRRQSRVRPAGSIRRRGLHPRRRSRGPRTSASPRRQRHRVPVHSYRSRRRWARLRYRQARLRCRAQRSRCGANRRVVQRRPDVFGIGAPVPVPEPRLNARRPTSITMPVTSPPTPTRRDGKSTSRPPRVPAVVPL